MANSVSMLALLFGVLALATSAAAHGGGLHVWSFWPEPTPGKEFIRHNVATCSSWQPVDPTLLVLGALPAFPAAPANIEVNGVASIWYYLDGNCTDKATTEVEINATVTINGVPYAGKQINGYGMIGACSNPTDLYRHNYTKGDNRLNLVWWRKENSVTDQSGLLWGAAPNVFVSRQPPATDGLRSLVLFPSPADSNPVCCDLVYNPPPPADFFTQGSFCSVPAPPPPSPPALPTSPSPSPSPKPSPKSPPPKSPPPKRPPPKKRSVRRAL